MRDPLIPMSRDPLRFAGPEDIEAPAGEEHTGVANWRRQALPWGVVKDKEIQLPLEAPSWLNSGDTSWQITAATLVGLMSVPGLAVLYGGVMQKRWSINSMMLTFANVLGRARRVGAVGVQDGLRLTVPRPFARRLLRELHRETRAGALAHRAAAPGEHPVDRERRVPAVGARLLPVRVRGDHADPGPGVSARARELQGVDPVLRAVDHVRLRGRRVPAVGRRLLRPARRGRLLRRLRHPPVAPAWPGSSRRR